jgi:hypothetical protein
MFVYLSEYKKGLHTMHVSPAGDPRTKGEVPTDWVDEKNTPLAFQVEFRNGKAEVDDSIGKYLLQHCNCRKTKLIIPEDD